MHIMSTDRYIIRCNCKCLLGVYYKLIMRGVWRGFLEGYGLAATPLPVPSSSASTPSPSTASAPP